MSSQVTPVHAILTTACGLRQAIPLIVALCFPWESGAQDNPPTLTAQQREELAHDIERAWRSYHVGIVEAQETVLRNVNAFRRDRPKKEVSFHHEVTYQSDGTRYRSRTDLELYNLTTNQKHRRQQRIGFDGVTHYHQQGDRIVLGESGSLGTHRLPQLFWSIYGEYLAQGVRSGALRFGGTSRILERDCILLEQTTEAGQVVSKTWLAKQCGYLPVRHQRFTGDRVHWQQDLSNLVQAENGVWYPKQIEKRDEIQSASLTITRFEQPTVWSPDTFQLTLPAGIAVQDYRRGMVYRNDPWWPELKQAMRDQFGWPAANLSAIRELQSYLAEGSEGSDAAPLQVQRWLNAEPVELRPGKTTLLYFTTGSPISPNPAWTSCLRELDKRFRTRGLEVVQISPADSDPATLQARAREMNVPWPIAIDQPHPQWQSGSPEGGRYGKTYASYRLRSYTSIVLVDSRGKIRTVQPDTLGKVLSEAFPVDQGMALPEVDSRFLSPPDGMELVLRDQWETWRKNVPQTASVRGQLRDSLGPITELAMQGRPRLELAGSLYTTLSTVILPHQDQVYRFETDTEGRYHLSGIPKGIYEISFQIPGQEREKRRIIVPANDSQVTYDIQL